VAFTSTNAVERFVSRLRDARSFGPARIAAIGEATAEALAAHGLVADLVPERFVAESLVDAFPDGPGRVLLPQAADARDALAEGLRRRGWGVDVVEAYRTERVQPPADVLAAAAVADAITFTSSSTVTNYLDLDVPVPPVVACIGPITAATARQRGLMVDAVAGVHSVDGLVAALVKLLVPST
jgi:uroporphyrinogen III methyltransferase/synthase